MIFPLKVKQTNDYSFYSIKTIFIKYNDSDKVLVDFYFHLTYACTVMGEFPKFSDYPSSYFRNC